MAVGRIISGGATVATAGTPVALSATRKVVRDLQVQQAWMTTALMIVGGPSVNGTNLQGTVVPSYEGRPVAVVFSGPIDLRQVYVDAAEANMTAVWIATEAE